MIDTTITLQELKYIVYTSENLTQAEFKMKDSIMIESILQEMIQIVERRSNKQPLWLVLHVNGVNEIKEYEEYALRKNHSKKALQINLTFKGINMLAL